MKTVYYIVFMYMGQLYCKIGEGEATRVNDFKREAPVGVVVLDYGVYEVAGNTRKVEKLVQDAYKETRCSQLIANTTEVFIVRDLQELRTRIVREINNEEARCIKRNKNAPRFLQITPDLNTCDMISAYAVEQQPRVILLLDDRDGEMFRSLVAHGYSKDDIFPVDTRNGYPSLEELVKFDLIIMNPPFSFGGHTTIWREFVKKALSMLLPEGTLIAVLPDTAAISYSWDSVLIPRLNFPNATQRGAVVVAKCGHKVEQINKGSRDDGFASVGLSSCRRRTTLEQIGSDTMFDEFKVRALYYDESCVYGAQITDGCTIVANCRQIVGPEEKLQAILKAFKGFAPDGKRFSRMNKKQVSELCLELFQ
jgi:hypothetical protein